ncbi:MAG TPA: SRPBCC domain-containing protein [Burkholderiaceae bacterium]|nr:SRPBCC domain-containing protein [Burkholderiaceae bacterium]
MSGADQARVMVSVDVPRDVAFDVFTREIDLWWRRGLKYRQFGGEHAIIAIEPRAGGRVFESPGDGGPVQERGRVLDWEPPARLRFEWRLANFAARERTEVEVVFEAVGGSTRVTVTHRGWSAIRDDHPARHGEAAAAFLRSLGLWWGGQLSVYRLRAAQHRA